MKTVPTYIHGIVDYSAGILLLLAPNIFGFAEQGAAAVSVARVIGVVVLLQAMLTDYELGAAKVISMRTHLALDMLVGAVLALSPWLFGFADLAVSVWLPHVIAGIAVVTLAVITQSVPRPRGERRKRGEFAHRYG